MPLFRRRTKQPPQPAPAPAAARPAPVIDPAYGNPGLLRARAAASARDWATLRAELEAVPEGAEQDWAIDTVTRVSGLEEWLPDVVAADPDDDLARVTLGGRLVDWAWEARTAASASRVSQEQFREFHTRLGQAETVLYEAAERAPGRSTAWYFLQPSGRGLEVGPDTARLRFAATVRRAPGHLGAHRQQLQQVCEKWGGSHEQMYAFADSSMRSAPPGSPLGELVPIAVLEEWQRTGRSGVAPELVPRLHEAADRSVRHADYRRTLDWTRTFNVFAAAFCLAGEYGAARELFAELDDRVTEYPWQYFKGRPAEAFATRRDRAARGGPAA